MIAVDTNVAIYYFSGKETKEVFFLQELFENCLAVFPPLVITELLSDPWISNKTIDFISSAPQIELKNGFFERAGRLRAKLLRRGLKARTADSLIAQSCIDSNVKLLTNDKDFLNFQRYCGLQLVQLK